MYTQDWRQTRAVICPPYPALCTQQVHAHGHPLPALHPAFSPALCQRMQAPLSTKPMCIMHPAHPAMHLKTLSSLAQTPLHRLSPTPNYTAQYSAHNRSWPITLPYLILSLFSTHKAPLGDYCGTRAHHMSHTPASQWTRRHSHSQPHMYTPSHTASPWVGCA